MLTRKEVESKGLIDGKDYLSIGGVRYQVGESFYQGDKKITVKSIIDPHHFNSHDNSCWHTGMFYDYNMFGERGRNRRKSNAVETPLRAGATVRVGALFETVRKRRIHRRYRLRRYEF